MVVHFTSLSTLVFVHICKNYNVILVDFSFDECAVPFPIPISFGLKSILSDIKIRYSHGYLTLLLRSICFEYLFFSFFYPEVCLSLILRDVAEGFILFPHSFCSCLLYCWSESIDFESYHYLLIPVSFFSDFLIPSFDLLTWYHDTLISSLNYIFIKHLMACGCEMVSCISGWPPFIV